MVRLPAWGVTTVSVFSPAFAIHICTPSKAAARGNLPVGYVPTNLPSVVRMRLTVLSCELHAQIVGPSWARPRTALPDLNVPRWTPPAARSFTTVPASGAEIPLVTGAPLPIHTFLPSKMAESGNGPVG